MSAMCQKHPVWFATLLGGAIGAVIGLAFGAYEVRFLHSALARGLSFLMVVGAHNGLRPLCSAHRCRRIGKCAWKTIQRALCWFPDRRRPIHGLGLRPLGAPLVRGEWMRTPAGIVITACLIAMLDAQPWWPDKWWARIVSAFGVAGWLLCGLAISTVSV